MAHSNIVGGSSADRILNCPGSYRMIQALPQLPESNEFADYGSAMHAVMDRLLGFFPQGMPPIGTVIDAASELLGEHFYDRHLEQHHLDDSIIPAVEKLYELMDAYGGWDTFTAAALEMQVEFPGVPGAFGTSDLLLLSQEWAIVADYKFGAGVPVSATYSDSAGDFVNPQLLFYLTAARATQPKLFRGRKLAIAIVQPRTPVQLTHTEVSLKEVKNFQEDLVAAVGKALGRDAALKRGDHCRWCPAKVMCPEWVGPIRELAAYAGVERIEPVTKLPTPYAEMLGNALNLLDTLELFAKEVREQAHAYLEDGGVIPGWQLQHKKKLRQWADEMKVSNTLYQLGFSKEDIWQPPKLQTFAVADKAAKRLGVKIPDELRVTPPATATEVARADGTAPALDRPTAIKQFEASVAALKSPRSV